MQVINQTPYQCGWGRFCVSFPASQYQLPNPHQSRPRLWNETKQNSSAHQGARQNTACFSVIGRRDLGGVACRGCNKAPRRAPDRLESHNKEWRRCGGRASLIPAKKMKDKRPKWQTQVSSLSASAVFCAALGRGRPSCRLWTLSGLWTRRCPPQPLRSWFLSSHEHGTAMLMDRLLVKLLCMAGLFFETPRRFINILPSLPLQKPSGLQDSYSRRRDRRREGGKEGRVEGVSLSSQATDWPTFNYS